MNLGGSWHEKRTFLVTHFSLPISGPLIPVVLAQGAPHAVVGERLAVHRGQQLATDGQRERVEFNLLIANEIGTPDPN